MHKNIFCLVNVYPSFLDKKSWVTTEGRVDCCNVNPRAFSPLHVLDFVYMKKNMILSVKDL